MTKPERLSRALLDQHPLPPVVDGDKETKGRLLVIAGSREVPGAALLTATAAMRVGAGKLRIAIPEGIATQIGIAMPEAMVVRLPSHDLDGIFAAKIVSEDSAKVDAVVAGPGMAANNDCARIAEALVGSGAALALDAAILHNLEPPKNDRSTTPILLPHRGELASLLDCGEEEIKRDPVGCGRRAAELYRSVVLVKGTTSHVVTAGGDCWTYEGGAPGLGVSGSGDVLAGIVGGLLARGAKPLNALLWAVWLHGEAGAGLGKKVGPIGFLAREIAGELPALLPR
ncbi:MAG: NAD(P)H-hydrate dehydratase [Pseudomonadota bacterium]